VQSARRAVVIVSRSEAVPVLTSIVIGPVNRTIRSIPNEIHLGPDEGLDLECVASFDNLQRISRNALTTKVGELGSDVARFVPT
jgi:mRNA interferase MazF